VNLSYEEFIENEELKRSFVRILEIIGEAAKYISIEFRNRYPKIKWKSIVGMRNKLIHEYFGIDYRVVWKTVKEKIPELYKVIEDLIRDLEIEF
jgi:uncharacterized protein with HEPN domain